MKFKVGDEVQITDIELCVDECISRKIVNSLVGIIMVVEGYNEYDGVLLEEDIVKYGWPEDGLSLVDSIEEE